MRARTDSFALLVVLTLVAWLGFTFGAILWEARHANCYHRHNPTVRNWPRGWVLQPSLEESLK